LIRKKVSACRTGQALLELLVVLPVLFLLLLAAADMGKLFVMTGKSEIAARYGALRHFRGPPFGDLYPANTEAEEIERIFFDDALDDDGLPGGMASEADDPDVTYTELGDADILYAPIDHGHPLLTVIWDFFNVMERYLPIRGVRTTFEYNLPSFPYGREHPFEQTLPLQDEPTDSRFAASYDAVGNFILLSDSFAGESGQQVKNLLEGTGFLAGLTFGSPALGGLIVLLLLLYLP